MGEVLRLAEGRAERAARGGSPTAGQRTGRRRPAFFFDLACPFSYLAAERVERLCDGIAWRPAAAAALHRRIPDAELTDRVRRAAERRALALGLPLEWPDRHPGETPRAMRAAAHAAEAGRGAAFALAAGRLAFCGGFDLEDPEVLAEAAAAAGVGLDATLAAARDTGRDARIDAAGRRLLAAGADRLPVVQAGSLLISGETRIAAAAAAGAFRLAAS